MKNWGMPNRNDATVEAAIRDVIFGYCHCIDAHADEELLDLFTADGEWWRPGEEVMKGREAIGRWLATRNRNLVGRHIASNVVIDVDGATQARAVSYFTVFKAGPGNAPLATVMGEYLDVFRLDHGRWRIARRETRRVFRAG